MMLQDLVKNIRVFDEFCDSLFYSWGGDICDRRSKGEGGIPNTIIPRLHLWREPPPHFLFLRITAFFPSVGVGIMLRRKAVKLL